jgi:hypothetical protein
VYIAVERKPFEVRLKTRSFGVEETLSKQLYI